MSGISYPLLIGHGQLDPLRKIRIYKTHEQTPGVPELDTADDPKCSPIRKEHHATRRRRSGTTHRLHPKNSHPILRPSGGPLEPPLVGVSGLRPRDPLEVPSATITHRGSPGLTA
ncbi:hypothetical protein Trydic_g7399 [Trypoxylus dichotomus]